MPGDAGALYEPLIERDLDAFPAAARAFAEAHSPEELWVAVARFAVLAYAPSQHGKRAVLAVRAAHEVRDELGERWVDLIVECARYAATSRQPWSEPPILEPPEPSAAGGLDELQAAIAAEDRPRAERWLAARIDDAEPALRTLATGDALLMLDAVLALEPLLGGKGRFALLRMVIEELFAGGEEVAGTLEELIDRAIEERGAVDAVRAVFVRAAESPRTAAPPVAATPLEPYPLARDYAQTLIAHAVARTLPHRRGEFLAAVHENLEHGESYAEWA
jgi:hypothetical protein